MTDDTRVILARRARLIAAALAGAGIGGGCGGAQSDKPHVCLESPGPSTEVIVPEPQGEATDDAPPPREDAGAALPPEDPKTRPRICLSEDF